MELPNEVWIKIAQSCDIPSLLSLSCTCRRLNNCCDLEIVWAAQWKNILTQFQNDNCDDSHANYVGFKDRCKRFITIFPDHEEIFKNKSSDVICCKCRGVLCNEKCIDDSEELIIFDIGSKTTWLKYEGENTGQLSMHPTVCHLPGVISSSENSYLTEYCPICNENRSMREKKWNIFGKNQKPHDPQPQKAGDKSSDKKKFTSALSKLSLKHFHCFDSSRLDTDSISSGDSESMSVALINKTDDVTDSVSLLGESSEQDEGSASGGKCIAEGNTGDVKAAETPLSNTEQLCVEAIMFLMRHMLKRNAFLYKRHVPYVICEPLSFTEKMKRQLIRYAFESLKIPGLCFIPKAVAVSLYVGYDTCLVVDSGANNTVLTPIVDQLNCDYRAQSKPVGGSHVSRWLQECIAMKAYDYEVEASKLDSSHVMRECWVAYNPSIESKRKLPNKEITVKGKNKEGIEKYFPVELSHELYLSVEDMYTKLNLPAMILSAVEHFSISTQRQLLSRIILSGGNCRLNGLANRLTRDLQGVCPEHSTFIHVCDPRLVSGRTDAVVGASYVKRWDHAEWITRSDYVFNGPSE